MSKLIDKLGRTEIRNLLAIIIVLACFALVFILCYREVPKDNKSILDITLGFVFGSLLTGVGGYFFGDKKNNDPSDKKDNV
jgi:uncharacterized BrkB/YihY/UPF0761 family membrane protein